jgi:hypothetical protein
LRVFEFCDGPTCRATARVNGGSSIAQLSESMPEWVLLAQGTPLGAFELDAALLNANDYLADASHVAGP